VNDAWRKSLGKGQCLAMVGEDVCKGASRHVLGQDGRPIPAGLFDRKQMFIFVKDFQAIFWMQSLFWGKEGKRTQFIPSFWFFPFLCEVALTRTQPFSIRY